MGWFQKHFSVCDLISNFFVGGYRLLYTQINIFLILVELNIIFTIFLLIGTKQKRRSLFGSKLIVDSLTQSNLQVILILSYSLDIIYEYKIVLGQKSPDKSLPTISPRYESPPTINPLWISPPNNCPRRAKTSRYWIFFLDWWTLVGTG